MKSLMKLFLVTVIMGGASSAFAQISKKTPPSQEQVPQADPSGKKSQTDPSAKDEASKDFESRMAKFQESYSKMQAKSSKVKDPKMKADLDAMLVRMNTINNDYNGMKATGTSEQQQKQTQQKIQADMKELRKMHDDMKAKYGEQMGGKKKGTQPQPADQNPPKESGEDLK